MKFNEQLTLLRKERNISQEALGEKLGVSRQAISKWENGATQPEMSNIEKLCELFDVSPNTLFGYEEKSKSVVISPTESSSEKIKTKNFLLFILLIIVLIIGICSGWFLHTIINPPVESAETIASFNITGCRFDTSTTKPFGPGKYIRFVFTPTLSGKDYSYTVITENEYNIQNTYTPTEENGIFETDILFSYGSTAFISIQCSNGKDSKTLTVVEVTYVSEDKFRYEPLYNN